ncbi:MAG: hypothetical protein K6F27_09775 [Ruminococcus sp.]|nr:hypothetical protein [Ruminococcus sp.]
MKHTIISIKTDGFNKLLNADITLYDNNESVQTLIKAIALSNALEDCRNNDQTRLLRTRCYTKEGKYHIECIFTTHRTHIYEKENVSGLDSPFINQAKDIKDGRNFKILLDSLLKNE